MMNNHANVDIVSSNSGVRQRFFDSQDYPPQNPYDSPGTYYPYSGYELEQGPSDYNNGRYGQGQGQATFHQHVYSTLAGHGGNGGGGGHGWSSGGSSGHKSKGSGLAMSGLTLLAFLFFINILQSCLKEQLTSMNPTVMVMTAGTSRYRKNVASHSATDANKELNQNEPTDNDGITSPISDNVDMLTNDEGDVFYGIAPKISLKLDDSFTARHTDSTLKRNKNST